MTSYLLSWKHCDTLVRKSSQQNKEGWQRHSFPALHHSEESHRFIKRGSRWLLTFLKLCFSKVGPSRILEAPQVLSSTLLLAFSSCSGKEEPTWDRKSAASELVWKSSICQWFPCYENDLIALFWHELMREIFFKKSFFLVWNWQWVCLMQFWQVVESCVHLSMALSKVQLVSPKLNASKTE